jgi:excinuclease ABC subunit C
MGKSFAVCPFFIYLFDKAVFLLKNRYMDLKNIKNIVKKDISATPGVYQFINSKREIIYIGKAANLKSRLFSYFRESADLSPAKKAMIAEAKKIKLIETESEIEALLLEANLVKKFQPRYNILLRDDKRHTYIKISLGDEIPGIFATRKIDRSGKYFGPFTSAQAVRETLKAIRKIWPYCAERKKKNLPALPAGRQAVKAGRPCFYYQINRCLGICAGLISKKEYLEKVIKPITLFLEGKKKMIVKNLELKIKNYNKELQNHLKDKNKHNELENKISLLNFQLLNLKNVLAHTNILSLHEKYEADVAELAKILNLPKVPERIEGYDISNIFGKEAVGSMIVFSGGEPNKSEYRKFKIKIGSSFAKATADKQGDVQMLKEVLERRLKKVPLIRGIKGVSEGDKKNNPPSPLYQGGGFWPLPDLIIIDGGKGQLNAVLKVLKSMKLDIPLIAISKGDGLRSALAPDKIFFPGEKKPLELPLASPALHLIKRVRDEAHRFAISYHRKLRGKSFFKRA